jgi:hypothetical protein
MEVIKKTYIDVATLFPLPVLQMKAIPYTIMKQYHISREQIIERTIKRINILKMVIHI